MLTEKSSREEMVEKATGVINDRSIAKNSALIIRQANTKEKIHAGKKRLDTLDLFRGIAILSVMLLHYTVGYRTHYGHFYSSDYDFRYGYMGVEFFFMISGFVIFLTALESKSVFDFVYKRITRLYPTFLFCMIATYLLVSFFGLPGREKSLYTAVLNVSMIPRFFGVPMVDGVYWSLVPEVFFYIFIMVLMLSKQVRNILIIGSIFLAVSWVHRYIYEFPPRWKMALNADWNALFFAGILFYKLKFEDGRKNLLIHLLVILSFVTICQILISATERIIMASFFIIFYLFSYGKLEWLRWKPLVFLGLISYPMYLFHQNAGLIVLNMIKPWLGHYAVIFIAVPVLVIIAISYLIHQFVERPSISVFRKWKNKLFDY